MEMDFLPAKCKTENLWFLNRNEMWKTKRNEKLKEKSLRRNLLGRKKSGEKESKFFLGFLSASPKICVSRPNYI